MTALMQHLALTRRRLAATPGFTTLAVLMVGVAIGAATAIFSIIDGALLKPLPVADPDRIVRLWETQREKGWESFSVAEANFLDWRARSRTLDRLGAITGRSSNLTGEEGPEQVQVARVSAEFLPLLGVAPTLGRLPREDEDQHGSGARVVVLTPGLWQRRFGSDPKVLGRTLTLDGEPHEIVGIAELPPLEFEADLFVPLAANPHAEREDHWLDVLAHLRPGATLDEARQEMAAIAAELAAEHPETNAGWGVRLVSLLDSLVGADARRAFAVLAGAVACLLLVAAANFSSLLLARAAGRRHELALRAALGAGRGRLVAQQLTEAVAVSVLAGGFGALVAMWGVDLFKVLDHGEIPRLGAVAVDVRAFAFALVLALGAGLVSGLLPAWQATAASPQEAMKESSTAVLGGSRQRRLQAGLVVAEVALSLVLLVGAGLLLRSYGELGKVPLGFEVEDRVTVGLSLPVGC